MNSRQTMIASVMAGIGASACCTAPLVLLALGIGGTWVATLTQLEPLRPYFSAAALVLLFLAWRKLYRAPVACEPGIPCAQPTVQKRQRMIFWVVAIALLTLLAFPSFAPLFYQEI